MTDFNVQPAALRELATLLDRAKEDINAARKYLNAEVGKIDGEGVINQVSGSHDTVVWTLDTWFGQVADSALGGASTAATESAAYYERTDHNSAAQLDATYPPEDTARFGDVVVPQQHLTDVADYTHKLDGSPGWWDAGSPMALFGSAIEIVTGIDPQAEIVKPWVGDWAGARSAADVFERLGHLSRNAAININWASQSTEAVWQGRAGENAALYLMNLGRPLNDGQRPLSELSDQYKTASKDTVDLRDAVVNILNAVGDAAIQAAFAAGVAGGAAATGVGAPVAVGAGCSPPGRSSASSTASARSWTSAAGSRPG